MDESGLEVGMEIDVRFLERTKGSVSVTLRDDHPRFSKRRLDTLEKGQELAGEVARVTSKFLLLDVGCTQLGFLPIAKMPNVDPQEDLQDLFQERQTLKAYVDSARGSQLSLTLKLGDDDEYDDPDDEYDDA
eukprot:TRINITY_DN99838_c0_g1_i1.p1 TRINITY_DN99838_c0_g1~~TRINITY_DN99838_c0_g1_i1.p1  ORF type:complete len:132 (-),score=30.68 TRINITY_DN99838_c0_g1_i1:99-494(-)